MKVHSMQNQRCWPGLVVKLRQTAASCAMTQSRHPRQGMRPRNKNKNKLPLQVRPLPLRITLIGYRALVA